MCAVFSLLAGQCRQQKVHSKKSRIHCGFRPRAPRPGSGSAPYVFVLVWHLFLPVFRSSQPPNKKTARFNPTPRQTLGRWQAARGGRAKQRIFLHRHHPESPPALWSNGIASVVHCSDCCKLVRKAGGRPLPRGRNRKEGGRNRFLLLSERSSGFVRPANMNEVHCKCILLRNRR